MGISLISLGNGTKCWIFFFFFKGAFAHFLQETKMKSYVFNFSSQPSKGLHEILNSSSEWMALELWHFVFVFLHYIKILSCLMGHKLMWVFFGFIRQILGLMLFREANVNALRAILGLICILLGLNNSSYHKGFFCLFY